MLATLNQVLKIAEEKQYAIAAFNTPTLEACSAVDKAEESSGTRHCGPRSASRAGHSPFCYRPLSGRLGEKRRRFPYASTWITARLWTI